MNIKRAFFAAIAVLMVPGLAMAQATTATFATTVDYTNGHTGAINVELTCNSGNPLVQDFDIAPGAGVTFSVANIDVSDVSVSCDIALSGLASGYTTATVCNYVGGSTLTATNTCDIMAEPMATTFSIAVDFDGIEDPSIDQSFDLDVTCTDVAADTGPVFGTVTDSVSGTGDSSFDWMLYADPSSGGSCSVTGATFASAIEIEHNCTDVDFMVGDATAACAIMATAFFEGIPTLSQYGMAIMALLMLGVGFVGFRRFV